MQTRAKRRISDTLAHTQKTTLTEDQCEKYRAVAPATLPSGVLPAPLLREIAGLLPMSDVLNLQATCKYLLFGRNAESYAQQWAGMSARLSQELACSVFYGFKRFFILAKDRKQLFAFGCNQDGQLGIGHMEETVGLKSVKLPLRTWETVLQGESGWSHTPVLTSDRRVFVWGDNQNGELGLGYTSPSPTPQEIKFPLRTGEHIDKVKAGDHHSAVLTNQGRVFLWGHNRFSQLGAGSLNQATPMEVALQLSLGEQVIDIQLGTMFSGFITNQGQSITYGANLGVNASHDVVLNQETIAKLRLSEGDEVKEAKSDIENVVVVTKTGRAIVWGREVYKYLGLNGSDDDVKRPIDIPYFSGILNKLAEIETRSQTSSAESGKRKRME